MIKSKLCGCNGAYILVNGNITTTGAGADDAAKRIDGSNKGVIFKNCAPFTDCISKINNTKVDNAEDMHVVMPIYDLREYIIVIIIQKHLDVSGNIA